MNRIEINYCYSHLRPTRENSPNRYGIQLRAMKNRKRKQTFKKEMHKNAVARDGYTFRTRMVDGKQQVPINRHRAKYTLQIIYSNIRLSATRTKWHGWTGPERYILSTRVLLSFTLRRGCYCDFVVFPTSLDTRHADTRP